MREQFVVPSIGSDKVVRAQRSFVRHCEDALKALDVGNGLFDVHAVPISNMSGAIVKRSGIGAFLRWPLEPFPTVSSDRRQVVRSFRDGG